MLTLIVGGLVLSLVVSLVASARGRSGIAWFILSLILSPLVSGVVLLMVGPARA